MFTRILVVGIMVLIPNRVSGETRRAKWEELSPLVDGKTISIVMPAGTVITGKAMSVEPEALLVHVTRTADRAAYPKGDLRVPRATLRTIEVHRKGVRYRIIGTIVGTLGGATAGGLAAIGITGGECCIDDSRDAAAAAVLGLTAAGAVGGYALGNSADRHPLIIEIAP